MIVLDFLLPSNRIKLPKLGWLRFYKSRDIVGEIRNATISRQAGHWYVSIQVRTEAPLRPISAVSSVGIDLGVSCFAALSNGEMVQPINSFRKHEKKLAKAQRLLSKKKKFSNNWKKQKYRIQQLHRKIACSRQYFLHKLSTTLSKNHAMIVVEALKIGNMSSSASGDMENPGRQVKAKSGLNLHNY